MPLSLKIWFTFMKNGPYLILKLLILLLLPQTAYSFNLAPYKWPTAATTMEVQFIGDPDTPAGSTNWNSAFEIAAARWGPNFNITVNHPAATTDPCGANNGLHDVGFHPTPCGFDIDGPGPLPADSFGSQTLAIALTVYDSAGLVTESEIVFNSNKNWGVYLGGSGTGPVFDFQRVAVHELGHVLGLDHSTVAGTIMYPTIGSTEHPQADDLAGVAAIYGATLGDEDGNHIVDIQDVIAIINIVLGSATPQGFGENCNTTGGIDIADVICAINVVLNN